MRLYRRTVNKATERPGKPVLIAHDAHRPVGLVSYQNPADGPDYVAGLIFRHDPPSCRRERGEAKYLLLLTQADLEILATNVAAILRPLLAKKG